MPNIEEKVESLLTKTIQNLNYELYDVIYEKEAGTYYLRIFIDKPEGISLNDCENVNNAISDLLDEANYIKDPYYLEVSSPGIERLIRKDKHLQENIEKKVVVSLYKPIVIDENTKQNKKNKPISQKQIVGILKAFDENTITVELEFKQNTKKQNIEQNEKKYTVIIQRKDISNIKTKYDWT